MAKKMKAGHRFVAFVESSDYHGARRLYPVYNEDSEYGFSAEKDAIEAVQDEFADAGYGETGHPVGVVFKAVARVVPAEPVKPKVEIVRVED